MEPEFINYSQHMIPSLQNVAIVQIVASLLAQPDVQKELKKLINKVHDLERKKQVVVGCYNFLEIEIIILKKLRLLCIPKKLYKEILSFVKPIGLQMIKCFLLVKGGHYRLRDFEHHCLYNSISNGTFHWSSWGTLDKIKTLEQAVFYNNKVFSRKCPKTLFMFACHYCCENCIFELWNRMTKDQKEKFFPGATASSISSAPNMNSHLVSYWVYCLENKLPSFCKRLKFHQRNRSIHSNMLKLAISSMSFLAVKYFWHKLAKEEKTDVNVLRWLVHGVKEYPKRLCYESQIPRECTDIIVFLLSQLSDQEQQKKVFKTYPELILRSLYNHWPYTMYFLPTINQMWDYIDVNLHIDILVTILTEAVERNASREIFYGLAKSTPENIRDRLFKSRWNSSKHEFLELLELMRVNHLYYIKMLDESC